MTSTTSGQRWWIYGIVFVTALIFRLLTLHVPESGGDSGHYFDCAWQLWHEPQLYQLDHQSTRWGIILPLALLRPLSWGPMLYSIVALMVSLATVMSVLRAGELLRSLFTGTVAALIIVFFPGVIDVASDLLPESFLLCYLSVTTMLLLEYRRRTSGGDGFLYAAAAVFVLAWWSKITVVEFLPAFLFLAYQRGRWISAGKFLGVFVAAVVVETVVYRLIWQEPWGIVSVVLHSHLSAANDASMTFLTSFWGLLGRYAPSVFRFYWWPLVLAAIVLFIVLLRRRELVPVWFLVIGEALFFLGITLGIKSVHPIETLEPFVTRYFITALPFMALFVAYGLAFFAEPLRKSWLAPLPLSLVGLAAIVGVAGFVSLPIIPAKWKARFLPLDQHPFVLIPQDIKLAATQRSDHLAVIGFNPGDPIQSIKGAGTYFTLFERNIVGNDPVPLTPRDTEVGRGAVQLGSEPLPTSDTEPVIWVQAAPLVVQKISWGELKKKEVQK